MIPKLEGTDAQLVNIMVRVSQAKGNWDHLIMEALDFLTKERQAALETAFAFLGWDDPQPARKTNAR
jgi:hypothetical protein